MDLDLFQSVADQMMTQAEIDIAGTKNKVNRTSSNRLRTVRFEAQSRTYQAIEQNPDKPSRWGQLAKQGHRVIQFRDVDSGKYVAVSVDGEVREY